YLDDADLAAIGGLSAAAAAGVDLLVAGAFSAEVQAAAEAGIRVLLRLPYRVGESDGERTSRLAVAGRRALWARHAPVLRALPAGAAEGAAPAGRRGCLGATPRPDGVRVRGRRALRADRRRARLAPGRQRPQPGADPQGGRHAHPRRRPRRLRAVRRRYA